MTENEMVPEQAGGVSQETPEVGKGVSQETPATGKEDASALKSMLAEREAALEKLETDLRKMKGSLQSQIAQREKDWKAREGQYQEELHKLRTAQMDEPERTAYEKQLTAEHLRAKDEHIATLEARLEEQRQMQAYQQFYLEQGIPAEELDLSNPEALAESGWKAMVRQKDALKARVAELEQKRSLKAKKTEPPAVVVGVGGEVATTTLSDLAKKYGSVEKVFKLIEAGELDGDLIVPNAGE